MDGNADRSTGVESANSGSESNHLRGHGRAIHCVKTAVDILEACNRQETAQARIILEEALLHLEEAQAVGEGQRSGEGLHEEAPQQAEVSG